MSELDRYREVVGKDPDALPDDHPYRWQWDYRGTKGEREELLERLELEDPDDTAPVVIDGQTDLFEEPAIPEGWGPSYEC